MGGKYIILIILTALILIGVISYYGVIMSSEDRAVEIIEETYREAQLRASEVITATEPPKTPEIALGLLLTASTSTVERIIRVVAEQEGISPDLMVRISWAESEFRNVRGRIDPRDRGIFQINSYWNDEVSDECAFDFWCASRWTANEIKEGRIWKWNKSKYKWDK